MRGRREALEPHEQRQLPLIPGIDGVGRTADGELLYFVLPGTTLGSMAEHAAIDRRRSVPLPDDSDVATPARWPSRSPSTSAPAT